MDAVILTVLIIDGVIIAVELVILAFMIHHIRKLGQQTKKLDKHLGQLLYNAAHNTLQEKNK